MSCLTVNENATKEDLNRFLNETLQKSADTERRTKHKWSSQRKSNSLKNSIKRDFKNGSFTLYYAKQASKMGNVHYAVEMLRSFQTLPWESQNEKRMEVLENIFDFVDTIPLWKDHGLFIIKAFYCTYFNDIYVMMLLSEKLFKKHPDMCLPICEWIFKSLDEDHLDKFNWAVVSRMLKACLDLPGEEIVVKYLLENVKPTKEIFEELFKVPVGNEELLEHFYPALDGTKELPLVVKPLFERGWGYKASGRSRACEALTWALRKLDDWHVCQRPIIKIKAMARQTRDTDLIRIVDKFCKEQMSKKHFNFKKGSVNSLFLKQNVFQAMKEKDTVKIASLFQCHSERKRHRLISEWNLLSRALAVNDETMLKFFIMEMKFNPTYDDVKSCATKDNFSSFHSILGPYLKPLEMIKEAINAGECDKAYEMGLFNNFTEKELQAFIMACYSKRSLTSLQVSLEHFPHTPVPLDIHKDDCPWIEGTQLLLGGIDGSNDLLHSIFCFYQLDKILEEQFTYSIGNTYKNHTVQYYMKVLSNIAGQTIPTLLAEFIFHPYDLHHINSRCRKLLNMDFYKEWHLNDGSATLYRQYETWRRETFDRVYYSQILAN